MYIYDLSVAGNKEMTAEFFKNSEIRSEKHNISLRSVINKLSIDNIYQHFRTPRFTRAMSKTFSIRILKKFRKCNQEMTAEFFTNKNSGQKSSQIN